MCIFTLMSNSIRKSMHPYEVLQTKASEGENNTRWDLADQASHQTPRNANLATPLRHSKQDAAVNSITP